MKKLIALILALVLCLSLCACGGGSSPATETNIPEISVIELNETITAGDYTFKVTKTEFVDQYEYKTPYGSHAEYVSEGNVHLVVDTTFNNVGKNQISIPYHFMKLEYGDGYIFELEGQYHYSFNSELFVANASELPLFGEDKPCQAYFEVPEVVMTNTAEPLKLIITISDQQFVYIIREGK